MRRNKLDKIRVLPCLLLAFLTLGQSAWATTWYLKGTDPTVAGNWTNGASVCSSFTTANDTFKLQKSATQPTNTWTLGSNGNPVNLIIDPGVTLAGANYSIDIWGTLTVNGGYTQPNGGAGKLRPKSDMIIGSAGSFQTKSDLPVGGNLLVNGTCTVNGGRALTVTGITTVNGTLSNIGTADGTLSSLAIGNGGTVNFAANSITVNGVTTINGTGKFTGTGANTFTGNVSINGTGASTSGATTFGGNLTVGDGTNEASLTLSGASTNVGATTIKSAATLALGTGGSLNTPNLLIARGATFDVSSKNAYTLGGSTVLQASGIKDSPATIKGGTSVSLGSQPMTLNYTPVNFNGENTSPALTLSQGNLTLNGAITVNIGGSTPLGAGSYTLISAPGGTISGSPALAGTTGPDGNGLESGPATLNLSTPGQVKLVVPVAADAVQLSRTVGVNPATYGDSLTFRAVLSPDPGNGAVVTFNTNGVLLGTATTISGVAELTVPNLLPSPSYMVTAMAAGHSIGVLADNPQMVLPKVLTLVGIAAQNKKYDERRTAVITGSLNTPEVIGSGTSGDGRPFIGDTLALSLSGNFATANTGTGIVVTATATLGGPSAGNYVLTQPTGLTADITALSTGREDEPYWLPAQSHTTRTLFSVATTRFGVMGRCEPKVYNGNLYGLYYRHEDARTMIYKAPLDGSPWVSGPLCSDTNAYRAFANPTDNHADFVISVDRAGYIHVSGGMHTGGLTHWYSVNPEDVSAFEYSPTSGKQQIGPGNCTFAKFRIDRHGQVFWNALQSSAKVPLISYDETTQQWTALGSPNPNNGETSFAWEDNVLYQDETTQGGWGTGFIDMVSDSNGRTHFAIALLNKTVHAPHPSFIGTDIIYAYSDDGGKTVYKSDGTQIQFPISATDGAATQGEVVLREQDDPNYNWLSIFLGISLDKADQPMIKVTSLGTGSHLFRLESGKWVDHHNYSPGSVPSTDPSGVVVGIDGDVGFKRSWNPTGGDNVDTLTFSQTVRGYDRDYYRDTGELVWANLSGSDADCTLTLYRTVLTRVSKVIGVDLQPSTANQGTLSGDVDGGIYTGLTNGIWNPLTGPGATSLTTATSQALVPMDGSPTKNPVKVTLGGGAGESFKFATWPAVTNVLRGDGIQFDATNTASISILISGLIPGNRYDLALFGSAGFSPTIAFNGSARLADGVFKDVFADMNGAIFGSFFCSGTNLNARLSGLQIQGIFVDPSTNDVSFQATEDAYVNQSAATTKYGTLTYLNVKAPVGGAGQMDAYLKFDVSSIDPATITHATLKVYSQTVAANIRVYQAASTWSQSGIIWNNAPGPLPPAPLLSQAVAAPNSWVSFDVTSAVQANDGQCSFVLRSDGTTAQKFTSMEAGSNVAVLTISRVPDVPPELPPPVSLAFTPANAGTWVSPDANLTAIFDQPIFSGTGTISIVRSSDDAIVETFDVATSPQLSFFGVTLTIDPTAALSPGTDYHILVATGAVVSASGRPYDGIADSTTWSFRTFVLNTLPYQESFEAYAAGEVWLADGVFTRGNSNHWTGSVGTLAPIVTNAYPWPHAYPLPGEIHTNVLRVVSGTVSNQLVSSDKSVLVDFMVQPTLDQGITEAQSPIDTNTQFAAFFSTNGLLHISSRDLAGGTNRWTQLTHAPLASNAWVRVRVRLLYDAAGSGMTFFTVRLNDGAWLEHADGFADVNGAPAPSTPGGRWFAAPSSASYHISSVGFGNSPFSLDDLSVTALVDGIFKDMPTVTWPTASDIAVGQTLQKVHLLGGSASHATAEVAGEFHFVPALETVVNSSAPYDVEFAPGSVNYFAVSGSVFVTALAGVYTTGTHTIPISFYANANLSPGDQGVATFEELDLLDNDGDGMTNWQEYIAGTNPKDSNSVFRVTGLTARPDAGTLTVKWIGGTRGPTLPYVVEAAPSLDGTPGAWVDMSNHNGRVEGTNTFSNSKTNSLLFIRIRATQE